MIKPKRHGLRVLLGWYNPRDTTFEYSGDDKTQETQPSGGMLVAKVSGGVLVGGMLVAN